MEHSFLPDNAVALTSVGGFSVPFVPKSSLKGVLRATCMQLANGMDASPATPAGGLRYRDWVHLLFGHAPDQTDPNAALLRVSDVLPILQEDGTLPAIKSKTSVGIERETRIQKHGHLFNTEVVQPGFPFSFHLRIENLPLDSYPKAWALLRNLIHYIETSGLSLGGQNSSGLGLFTIDPRTRIYVFSDPAHFARPATVTGRSWREFLTLLDSHV